jgi:hypothetical protein
MTKPTVKNLIEIYRFVLTKGYSIRLLDQHYWVISALRRDGAKVWIESQKRWV